MSSNFAGPSKSFKKSSPVTYFFDYSTIAGLGVVVTFFVLKTSSVIIDFMSKLISSNFMPFAPVSMFIPF